MGNKGGELFTALLIEDSRIYFLNSTIAFLLRDRYNHYFPMHVEYLCSFLVYFYAFSIGKPWGERNRVCILIHLPLSTAIDLIAIRVLLKWIIVCHDKISTRFKVVFQRHIDDRSILSSLRSFPFVPRVRLRFFLFFFVPKFLIKSVSDISGKNSLSKKNAFFFLFQSVYSSFLFFFSSFWHNKNLFENSCLYDSRN